MNKENRHIKLIIPNSSNTPMILNSFSDYQQWYLGRHDFSIFSAEDVWALLEEDQPQHYPCTPIVTSSLGEIFYLDMREITIQRTV